MAMTLAELREFVRAFPDLDDEDLPNGVLDVLLREGHNRITRSERTWSFYAVANTLGVSADTQTYDMATLFDDPMSVVTDVLGTNWQLKPIPHKTALARYPTQVSTTRQPNFWSVQGDTLYLWPIPDATYTWTVTGYRKPRAFTAVGDEPDLPDEFHELVAIWGLGRAYAQQDDLEQAGFWRGQFDEGLRTLRKHYAGVGVATGLVLAGGPNAESHAPGLRYEWE